MIDIHFELAFHIPSGCNCNACVRWMDISIYLSLYLSLYIHTYPIYIALAYLVVVSL